MTDKTVFIGANNGGLEIFLVLETWLLEISRLQRLSNM